MTSRSLLLPLVAALVLAVSTLAPGVTAATCAPICSRADVYGFGANGASRCLCADRLMTGCNCSNCYLENGDGTVQTYAYDSGRCPWNSVDCSPTVCDKDPVTTTPTPNNTTAPTVTPTLTPQSPAPTSAVPAPAVSAPPAAASASPVPVNGTGAGTDTPAPIITTRAPPAPSASPTNGSSTTNSTTPGTALESATTSDGMQTWQIVLIICCAALVFAVAVMALLSCYCKARRRLNESENFESDVGYYHQPPLSGAGATGASKSQALQGGTGAAAANASRRSSLGVDTTTEYYDNPTSRQMYAKAPATAYAGSYPGSESRYTTAIGSVASSPDRTSPPPLTRPSAGSSGDLSMSSSSSFGSDRRRGSSIHSQAVTL